MDALQAIVLKTNHMKRVTAKENVGERFYLCSAEIGQNNTDPLILRYVLERNSSSIQMVEHTWTSIVFKSLHRKTH